MRSIAISHAFVMGGDVGGSERTLSIGGSEQVSPQVFKDFHYTALGHLHGPQRMGADYIRYSGIAIKSIPLMSIHRRSLLPSLIWMQKVT